MSRPATNSPDSPGRLSPPGPLALAAAALACGIFAADLLPWTPALVLLPALALALLRLAPWRNPVRSAPLWLVLPFVLGFALHGAKSLSPPSPLAEAARTGAEGTLQGRVREVRTMGGPDDRVSRVRITVDAETWKPANGQDEAAEPRPVSGIVRLGSPPLPLPLSPGDIAEFPVRLRPPVPFRNFGADEKERYLERLGIAASGSVTSPWAVQAVHRSPATVSPIAAWRTRIETIIARSFPTAEGSVLSALVIGEERAIPQGTRDDFQSAGVTHILSVSGSHLGLVALVCGASAVLFLRILPSRAILGVTRRVSPLKAAALSALPVVSGYALLSGAAVPTVRAWVMLAVYSAAVLIDRERQVLDALGLAAVLILVHNTQTLFQIGFQLSFLSVAAIALVSSWKETEDPLLAYAPRPPRTRLVGAARKTLGVSAAALAVTAPVTLHHFQQASLAGIVSNIVVIPFAGFILVPAGLFLSLASLTASSETFIGAQVLSPLLSLFLKIVAFFASVPGAAFHAAPPPAAPMLLSVLAVLILIGPRPWAAGRIALAGVLLAAALLGWTAPAFVEERGPRACATFLDVGQGDSAWVRAPDGRVIVVDAGGAPDDAPDPGRLAVEPALRRAGVRRIDVLVLSHAHHDHIGGARHLLGKFPVGEVWDAGLHQDLPSYRGLLDEIERRGIPVRVLNYPSPPADFGGLRIDVLHPPAGYFPHSPRGAYADENSLSLALRLSLGDVSFFLPGDLEEEGEREIAAFGQGLRSTVLKVPHHGGRTSSTGTLLATVRPRLAVVSAGRRNRFGHPHAETLSRYDAFGIPLLRTDRDGAVRVCTDGRTYGIETAESSRDRPALWLRPFRYDPAREWKNVSAIFIGR
ncbi:MAG: DNA internalization-related competence protein ComEC/Rec2 [Nitrospirae bacterium RBG_16_64_22]|nr:MAG: DNA internalization-related competence protein ComEC/Rec2 [Nitrospirae bacterium RBG_16_64_22]